MKEKLYIATSTSNFNNILSTESISPAGFYSRRNFGYRNFKKVGPNACDGCIVLYDQIPKFAVENKDIDDYPLVIELSRYSDIVNCADLKLHSEIDTDMGQLIPDTLENITAYVRNDLCIGAWQGSRLGGYLIVRFCGRSAHNYAAFMDVPRTEWEHWANADSAIVHADFRGNGLQRLMLEAALPLFPKKITHIGATVSPQNQYSLHNALASGFAIVSRREMYGGHDRYLLKKDL